MAALVPALFRHRWIEQPLRRSKAHLRRPRAILFCAIAGPAAAVASGVALSASLAVDRRGSSARDAEGAGQLRADRARSSATATALRPRPVDASRDRGRAPTATAAGAERGDGLAPVRLRGPAARRRTVVLFGDSHAMQLFPALDHVVGAAAGGS